MFTLSYQPFLVLLTQSGLEKSLILYRGFWGIFLLLENEALCSHDTEKKYETAYLTLLTKV